MITAYLLLQQAASAFGIPVLMDDIPGPLTDHCARIIAANIVHRKALPQTSETGVRLPLFGGRASHYGGPNDPGDYYEGQAYLPIADPDGSGPKPATMTPAEYYAMPAVANLRCFLRPEMATTTTWSVKGVGKVGVSWFLNEDAPYCAARLYGDLAKRARTMEGLFLRVTNTAVKADGVYLSEVCRVIDWGPAEIYNGGPWRFKIDLSPGVYRRLRLRGKWDGKRWLDSVDWEVL